MLGLQATLQLKVVKEIDTLRPCRVITTRRRLFLLLLVFLSVFLRLLWVVFLQDLLGHGDLEAKCTPYWSILKTTSIHIHPINTLQPTNFEPCYFLLGGEKETPTSKCKLFKTTGEVKCCSNVFLSRNSGCLCVPKSKPNCQWVTGLHRMNGVVQSTFHGRGWRWWGGGARRCALWLGLFGRAFSRANHPHQLIILWHTPSQKPPEMSNWICFPKSLKIVLLCFEQIYQFTPNLSTYQLRTLLHTTAQQMQDAPTSSTENTIQRVHVIFSKTTVGGMS